MKRKNPKKRAKITLPIKSVPPKMKLFNKGGPFTLDQQTGVKIPNPQLLNERIKHPVFKSRYPRRKTKY